MKKSASRAGLFALSIWLRITLLLCVLPVMGIAAETTSNCIDAVILLDCSNSMIYTDGETNKLAGNDIKGYRIDAAQMFISMCDFNGSRVAVIPFAFKLLNPDTEFTALSSETTRNSMIKDLEKLRGGAKNGTNVGLALSTAVQMLSNRDNSTNKPMILLLTDGKNSEGNEVDGENLVAPKWNKQTNSFENATYRQFTAADSDELMELATDAAETLGYPIYTIALFKENKDAPSVKPYFDVLNRMSQRTYEGGECQHVNAANSNELPRYFGEMLARQIGSSLTRTLNPTPVPNDPNCYQADLPILNSSVMEANIYIPLAESRNSDGIISNQIWLIDPKGIDISSGDNQSVFRMTSPNHFVVYKIIQPKVVGNWKLKFKVNGDTDVNDINFSILYNYDITLKTTIGVSSVAMSDADGLEFNKFDKLQLRGEFYQNSTGAPTSDNNLYQVIGDGNNWETINMSYSITDANENELKVGVMPATNNRSFESAIDFSNDFKDDSGYNTLKSGEYFVRFCAEGAGLKRENVQHINVVNTPVTSSANQQQGIVLSAEVENPTKPETMSVQTLSYKISNYFMDRDNDKLSYYLESADAETNTAQTGSIMPESSRTADLLPLRLVEKSDGWHVEGSTIMDPSYGHIRYGSAKYYITASDNESSVKVPFTIRISNRTIKDLRNYTCNVQVTGLNQQNEAPKNSDVTFSMNIVDTNGVADTTGAIDNYTGSVSIVDANNKSVSIETGDMVLDNSSVEMSYTFNTGNRKGDYHVICSFFYNNNPAYSQEFDFSVKNTKPVISSITLHKLPNDLSFIGKGFVPVLENPTSLDARTIKLRELFTDSDNEQLTFSEPKLTFVSSDENRSAPITATRSGDDVVLDVIGTGTATLTIIATDNDGETVTLKKDFSLTDLRQRWLFYWIALLIAVIIFFLIIKLIVFCLKPEYNSESFIELMEGSVSMGVSGGAHNLPSGRRRKKTTSIDTLIDQTVAQNNSIDPSKLTSVRIKPHNPKSSGSVDVWLSKPIPDYEVKLDDVPIGSKHKEWKREQNLSIRNLRDKGTIRLHLTKTPEIGVMGFGGGGSFSGGGFGDDISGFGGGFNDSGFNTGSGFDNNNSGFGNNGFDMDGNVDSDKNSAAGFSSSNNKTSNDDSGFGDDSFSSFTGGNGFGD